MEIETAVLYITDPYNLNEIWRQVLQVKSKSNQLIINPLSLIILPNVFSELSVTVGN